MTPKERIRVIRLMEHFSEQSEYFHQIGVSIEFHQRSIASVNENAED